MGAGVKAKACSTLRACASEKLRRKCLWSGYFPSERVCQRVDLSSLWSDRLGQTGGKDRVCCDGVVALSGRLWWVGMPARVRERVSEARSIHAGQSVVSGC